ncbi:MAG TPA: GTP cyclohydrolase FolE2 [Gemmatimonadaceae bacterium]|nr:GTP cyclohydrolase FolE2 [Gemmatimonadaceae bacterium]
MTAASTDYIAQQSLADIQNLPDTRGLPLDNVGVKDIRCPIIVLDREAAKQHTVASVNLSVSLPHHFKGTHMSRFVEILENHRGELTMRTIPSLLEDMRRRLAAERARVEVRFPYFIRRAAPASGATALMDYQCWFIGERDDTSSDFVLGVEVPVTSLCPCSREISDYGAHNQRGHISIEVRPVRGSDEAPVLIWIEELIQVAEGSASAPVYPLLKRVDERHVTMQAYDNPVFVEDMVRNVAVQLQDDIRVAWCSVRAVNQESIHNHNAFAAVEWTRPPHSI